MRPSITRSLRQFMLPVATLLLAACGSQQVDVAKDGASSTPSKTAQQVPVKQGGGYYLDDGPHATAPADLDVLPDAVPSIEPVRSANSRPYTVMGKRYRPMLAREPYREQGAASWYGRKFHGRQTANGETYDMYEMTAAHKTLPLPSYARVTSLENGRSVIVRVNDRGPFLHDRIIDLSYAAANRLGFVNSGTGKVEVELLMPDEILAMTSAQEKIEVAATPEPVTPAPRTDSKMENAVSSRVLMTASAVQEKPIAPLSGPVPYLQLAAFDTPNNAAELMAKVRDSFDLFSEYMHLLDGDGRYRLQIGPFSSVEEAESFAGRVTNALKLNPYLVMR